MAGKDRFADYVITYRQPYPYDGSPEYGAEFPDFLELMQSEDFPFLPDVAQLEWLVYGARRAEDAPTLDAAALNAIPSERFGETRLTLHPSCGLLRSPYDVARLWEIHQPDYAGEREVEELCVHTFILVNRPGNRVEVSRIDQGGFAFLQAIARGETLADAYGSARAVKADFDLAEALQDAAARRLFRATA